MATTPSAYMSLPVPIVGQEAGPDWALDLNACLTGLDSHDHSSGKGVKVTPNGLDITIDLPLQSHNLVSVRSVRLDSQGAVLSLPEDIGCLSNVNGDLYYNDGNGNNIRITQSGGVAAGTGQIANLNPPASVAFVALSATFVFEATTNTAAHLDIGNVLLRNTVGSKKALTLSAPTGLSADYNIVLPPKVGSGTKFVRQDSSGNQNVDVEIDGTSLEISSNILKIKGVGTSTAGQILTADGVGGSAFADRFKPAVTTFTSSGTMVVPAGVTRVIVEAWGGGGGGGSGASDLPSNGYDGFDGGDTTVSSATMGLLIAWGGARGICGYSSITPDNWGGRTGGNPGYGAGGLRASENQGFPFTNGGGPGGYGAGGGGGSGKWNGSGEGGKGGGAGGHFCRVVSVTPGETISVTIGTGGAGGANRNAVTNNGAGGAGGDGIVFVTTLA